MATLAFVFVVLDANVLSRATRAMSDFGHIGGLAMEQSTNGTADLLIAPPGELSLSPPTGLDQTGHLVLGPGARRDANSGLWSLQKLSSDQQTAVQRAKKYAMEQSIKMVLMRQTIAHQQQQAKSLQRHQAVVLMCRVYVGSINFEVKEDTIRQAFLPFGPIRSISLSYDPLTQKHKGFAFVEYEMPEAAQLALEQMNGVIISGRNIKVGRPSNMPQAQVVIDDITEQAKKYSRIYIASIHPDLTEDDIRSVFEAFGPIVSCELCMTAIPGKHRGFGFIEYHTVQATMDAIASMNLFDLGGQYLRVGRAITPPDTQNQGPPSAIPQVLPTAAAVAAAAATAKIQAMDAVASNLGLTDLVHAKSEVPKSSSSRFGPQVSGALPPPAVVVAPPVVMTQLPAVVSQQPGLYIPVAPVAPPALVVPGAYIGQPSPAELLAKAEAEAKKRQQEELHKKLMEDIEPSTLQQQEDMSIKGQSARHLVMQKLMRAQSESVVVLLKNMVTPEEVDDALQEEIGDECKKYGDVERVIIYQEKQSEEDDAEVIVKIFVEFKRPDSAQRAKDSLHGRFFGGSRIVAELYDQELFDHGDLSG